jgi:hypothetical protein
MTVAVALFLGAAIVALTGAALLRRMAARAVDPVAVIVGWVLAVLGVLGTATAALVVMMVPATVADSPLARLVRRSWWSAVQDAPEFAAYHLAGWVAMAVLGIGVLRLCWVGVRHGRARRRRVRGQLEVLRMVATTVACPDGGPPRSGSAPTAPSPSASAAGPARSCSPTACTVTSPSTASEPSSRTNAPTCVAAIT